MGKTMAGSRLLVLAVAASVLAACGVKSSPDHPADATYPRKYPAPETTPVPKAKSKDATVAPGGFPYDYPNRPPTR